jgi:hypothetical protein
MFVRRFREGKNFERGLQFRKPDFKVEFNLPKPRFKLSGNPVNERKAPNK